MFCRRLLVTNSSTTSFVCFGFAEVHNAESVLVQMAKFLEVPDIDGMEPWDLDEEIQRPAKVEWPTLAINYFPESEILVVSTRESIQELNCVTVLEPAEFQKMDTELWTTDLEECAAAIGYEPDCIGIVIGADVST
jgi:hypothetical protein